MVVSRNAVRVLMSIELMLNAVNINLVAFARYVDPVQVKGQLFAIFVITVAAAEAAVGLAIVLSIYRNTLQSIWTFQPPEVVISFGNFLKKLDL